MVAADVGSSVLSAVECQLYGSDFTIFSQLSIFVPLVLQGRVLFTLL